MDDDVVGFQAQQAVEKAIKVTLVMRGIDFPRTHDIDFLLARADGHGLGLPEEVEDAGLAGAVGRPTPLRRDGRALNRSAAIGAATSAVEWARSLLDR